MKKRLQDHTDEELLDLLRKAGFPKTAEDKLFILRAVAKVLPG